MPSVSRETVLAAVRKYGEAWTAQDPTQIENLFTQNAIYVERPFDRKATFRGREAIKKYWKYQICGKQSNILFRHVESEMVRDADRPIAVVKWLAEFDNFRENRAGKGEKKVRFCQIAKLIFEGSKICYLEEYAQGMAGSAVKWPGIDATEEDLWSRIRFDPPKPPPAVACELCNSRFPSRTQLFTHLKETTYTEGPDGTCTPNLRTKREALLCLSITYTCKFPEEILVDAFHKLGCDFFGKVEALTWAVPPNLSGMALVNIVTIKFVHIPKKDIPFALISSKISEITKNQIVVHGGGLVNRPCAPERREFEKYAVFIPWVFLKSQGNCEANDASIKVGESPTMKAFIDKNEMNKSGSPRVKMWRKPLEETAASMFTTKDILSATKRAARLVQEASENVFKFRSSTMDEPFHHCCKLSISMLNSPGDIENLVGLMIAYVRSDIDRTEFEAKLEENSSHYPRHTLIRAFPSELVVLMEPAISRYENKVKLSLCRNKGMSDKVATSIEHAEMAILCETDKRQDILIDWISDRNDLQNLKNDL